MTGFPNRLSRYHNGVEGSAKIVVRMIRSWFCLGGEDREDARAAGMPA